MKQDQLPGDLATKSVERNCFRQQQELVASLDMVKSRCGLDSDGEAPRTVGWYEALQEGSTADLVEKKD